MTRRILQVLSTLALAGTVALPRAVLGSAPHQALAAPASFSVSYAGVDYVDPAPGLTGCAEWTWLQPSCYTNSSLTPSHLSPQQVFASDVAYIQAQHLGNFQRVWISLDQLMNWNSTTGYAGYNAQALANVDDMLHRAAAAGVKLDLVLLTWVQASYPNQFRPQALDGNHAAMRANYLQAVHDFVAHVAADPVDASAVSVMDLQAEGYYQLETYFNSLANLGQWDYSMPAWPQNTQCYALGNTLCTGGSAGHGCVSGSAANTACVDVNIIEPWFKDLYNTAKAAGPNFNYTISDTGRLLTTSTGAYTSQNWWVSMYPVDVYDIHLYSDSPSAQASRWATGLTLPKPWFAGEVGCTTSNTTCTYSGTAALPVDQWWLGNMAADGARAVLIEDRRTAWTYTYTNLNNQEVPTLTSIGQLIAADNQPSSPTSTPVSTSTLTSTPPPTSTPVPTNTATSTATNTPPPTSTPLPTSTSTSTPAPASTPLFATNFDSQAAGPLQLASTSSLSNALSGGTSSLFTGVSGKTAPSVETGVDASASNGLVAPLSGGGASFAFTQYPAAHLTHDLRFSLQLGADESLPASSYMILARTAPSATTLPGRVDIVMNGSGTLFLDYYTGAGALTYLWLSGRPLVRGAWHTLELRESAGTRTGSLQLLLDGQTIGQASGLNLGAGGVGYFAVGDVTTPLNAATAGHLYLDNVTATTTA